MAKGKRIELRISDDQYTLLKRTAQDRGYRSISAYVAATVTKDLRESGGGQPDGVQAFVASLDRLSREIRTTHTTQQAVFAAIDTLVRLFLTCVPEPAPEVLDNAKRRARLRYDSSSPSPRTSLRIPAPLYRN